MIRFRKYSLVLESFSDFKKKMLYDIDGRIIDDYIKRYKNLQSNRQIKSPENDIGYWMSKDFAEFSRFVKDKESAYERSIPLKKKFKEKDAPIVAEGPGFVVYKILSKAASCKLGSDTDWCITKGHQNYYEQYVYGDDDQFYFIFTNDKNPLLQKVAVVVDSSGDLMLYDKGDTRINLNKQNDFFREYPVPHDIFKKKEESETLKNRYIKANMKISDEMLEEIKARWGSATGDVIKPYSPSELVVGYSSGLTGFLMKYGSSETKNLYNRMINSDSEYNRHRKDAYYEMEDMFDESSVAEWLEEKYESDREYWEDDPMGYLANLSSVQVECLNALTEGWSKGTSDFIEMMIDDALKEIKVWYDDHDTDEIARAEYGSNNEVFMIMKNNDVIDLLDSLKSAQDGIEFQIDVGDDDEDFKRFDKEAFRDFIRNSDILYRITK